MSQPNTPPRDFVSSSSMSVHTLPEGTRLRDFEICGLIGEGGFGIVYLADDHSLGRRVAIKEYMPASMASRAHASSAVVVKSQRHEETFKLGLKSFVNEARLLARFDHPALVKVYRFWEENGTAYMVMPYYQGPTLKSALTALGRPPTETELRNWLRPLIDALSVMHAANCFHRDIAPDNILLTTAGPLLLDFGAARHVIADMTHALTVVLKPGYAPIEQYGEVPSLTQGAWTDLYALASVVYTAISGKAPISAVERLMDDRHVPLAQLPQVAAGGYSENFVRAIDAALHVRPRDRPQDVQAFRSLFDGGVTAEVRSPLDFVSTFGSLHDSTLVVTQPPTHPDTPRHERTVPGDEDAVVPPPPKPIATAPSIDPASASATNLTAATVMVAKPAPLPAPAPAMTPTVAAPPAPTRAAVTSAANANAAPSAAPRASGSKSPAIVAIALIGVAVVGAAVWFATNSNRVDSEVTPASAIKDPAPTASVATPDTQAQATTTTPAAVSTAPSPQVAPAPTQSATPPIAQPDVPAAVIEVPTAPTPKTDAPSATAASPHAAPAHREARSPASAPAATAATDARPRTAERTPERSPERVPERTQERAQERTTAETPPPKNAAQTRARCSDILQKASLEPLTASEAAFLRRECQ